MATQNYLAGEGGLHIQACGPGSESDYLGCHEVGDIAAPKGDITLLFCPDPTRTGQFKVKGSFQAAPGPVTTTITTQTTAIADYLEKQNCPFALYIIKNKCGFRTGFEVQGAGGNRVFILDTTFVTNEGIAGVLAMTPENNAETQQTFDLSAHGLIRVWGISSSRVTITETENINGITACSEVQCRDSCGNCSDVCDTLYAGADAVALATANLLESTDSGATWAATATDPFAADEHIEAVECVKMATGSWRVIVGTSTTDVAKNAQVNYSDDGGATWAGAIEMPGGVNGETINTPNGIFALDKRHVWAVTYAAATNSVNFSDDGGASWTSQGDNVGGLQGLNAVHFYDENNGWVGGDANTLARTNDGGAVWTTIAGPTAQATDNILSIAVVTPAHIIIGYDNLGASTSGEVWQTLNGTDQTPTWTQVSTASALTDIKAIKFANEYIGYFVGASSGNNNLYRTFDGGYTWEAVDQPTNGGLNDLTICSNNSVFYTGEVSGGTGFVGKAV